MIRQLSVCLLLYFLVFVNQIVVHSYILHASVRNRARNAVDGELVNALDYLFRTMAVIVSCHLVNITMWAIVFLVIGVTEDFEMSFYVSITNYTTLGTGDVVLPKQWNLLAPFEALCGIIMFAWSISFFYSIHQYIMTKRLDLGKIN
ncbi:MAG: hypothetical protein HY795_06460 [Desulfovibrio sp.]|nr:hypothetical protein [Desulfovibrio sp.]MBI4961259.1 hypothetical protein [Desulfovibrio sp.]